MDKSIILAHRRRKINGGFGWVEHRFIREGHLQNLSAPEIALYFFLALVSDANGISFYGPERTMALLKLDEADYFGGLSGLEQKDYISRDGNKIQLLSLPKYQKPSNIQKRHNKTLSLAQLLEEAGHGQR